MGGAGWSACCTWKLEYSCDPPGSAVHARCEHQLPALLMRRRLLGSTFCGLSWPAGGRRQQHARRSGPLSCAAWCRASSSCYGAASAPGGWLWGSRLTRRQALPWLSSTTAASCWPPAGKAGLSGLRCAAAWASGMLAACWPRLCKPGGRPPSRQSAGGLAACDWLCLQSFETALSCQPTICQHCDHSRAQLGLPRPSILQASGGCLQPAPPAAPPPRHPVRMARCSSGPAVSACPGRPRQGSAGAPPAGPGAGGLAAGCPGRQAVPHSGGGAPAAGRCGARQPGAAAQGAAGECVGGMWCGLSAVQGFGCLDRLMTACFFGFRFLCAAANFLS